MPTEAQWENACRAGTDTSLYTGENLTDTTVDARLDILGRYQYNGGKIYNSETGNWDAPPSSCAPSNGTATVGSYLPNAWGLYDMLGNVQELCLDWYTVSLGTSSVTNPPGAYEGTSRVTRSGHWGSVASSERNAARASRDPATGSTWICGFRLILQQP